MSLIDLMNPSKGGIRLASQGPRDEGGPGASFRLRLWAPGLLTFLLLHLSSGELTLAASVSGTGMNGAASDASTALALVNSTLDSSSVEAPPLPLMAQGATPPPLVDENLASSSVEATTATLTISGYTAAWYYKANAAPDTGCKGPVAANTTTKALTNLSTNTSYTYKAYSDSGCSTELGATSPFLTKPGTPTTPVAAAGAGSGKLTINASVTGNGTLSKWQYQQKASTDSDYGSWQNVSSTAKSLSHTVSGLSDGTDYQFKVRAVNATGTGATSDASSAVAPVVDQNLASSSVEATTATLTIGNHSSNWYYKANAAPDKSCKGPVSIATKNLTGLSTNTIYTYKAYSDSSCSTELAAAVSVFLTKPSKPQNFHATSAVERSGTIVFSAFVRGNGTIRWERQTKVGNGNFGSWEDLGNALDFHGQHGLGFIDNSFTDGISYQFKIRAVNSSGHGAASDVSDVVIPGVASAPAPTPKPSVIISEKSLEIPKGGSGQYTVKLSRKPSGDVIITPKVKNASGPVSVKFEPSQLTFTEDNWKESQAITVSGFIIGQPSGNFTITHAISGEDYDYQNISAPDVMVKVLEHGVIISPQSLEIPKGGSAEYTVMLSRPPSDDVIITPSLSPTIPSGFSGPIARWVGPDLIFTQDNWDKPQSMRVTPESGDEDGDYTITHYVSSTDTDYQGISAPDVMMKVFTPDSLNSLGELKDTLRYMTDKKWPLACEVFQMIKRNHGVQCSDPEDLKEEIKDLDDNDLQQLKSASLFQIRNSKDLRIIERDDLIFNRRNISSILDFMPNLRELHIMGNHELDSIYLDLGGYSIDSLFINKNDSLKHVSIINLKTKNLVISRFSSDIEHHVYPSSTTTPGDPRSSTEVPGHWLEYFPYCSNDTYKVECLRAYRGEGTGNNQLQTITLRSGVTVEKQLSIGTSSEIFSIDLINATMGVGSSIKINTAVYGQTVFKVNSRSKLLDLKIPSVDDLYLDYTDLINDQYTINEEINHRNGTKYASSNFTKITTTCHTLRNNPDLASTINSYLTAISEDRTRMPFQNEFEDDQNPAYFVPFKDAILMGPAPFFPLGIPTIKDILIIKDSSGCKEDYETYASAQTNVAVVADELQTILTPILNFLGDDKVGVTSAAISACASVNKGDVVDGKINGFDDQKLKTTIGTVAKESYSEAGLGNVDQVLGEIDEQKDWQKLVKDSLSLLANTAGPAYDIAKCLDNLGLTDDVVKSTGQAISRTLSRVVGVAITRSVVTNVTLQALGQVTKKIASTAITKGIPIVGYGFLAYDIYTGYDAQNIFYLNDATLEFMTDFLVQHGPALESGDFDWAQAFSGKSIALPLSFETAVEDIDLDHQDASEGHTMKAGFRARFDYSKFSDSEDNFAIDGRTYTYAFGFDIQPKPFLDTGLSLLYIASIADYENIDSKYDIETKGTVNTYLTSIHPFARWKANDKFSLYGSLGYGRANMKLTVDEVADSMFSFMEGVSSESEGTYSSATAGISYTVWQSDTTDLALKLDGTTTTFLDSSSRNARLTTALSHDFVFDAGVLTNGLDLSLVMSDADPAVVELAGRLGWRGEGSRFSGSTRARILLFGGERKEWGVGGSLNFQPLGNGEGLDLEVRPSIGRTGQRFFEEDSFFSILEDSDLSFSGDATYTPQLSFELGYGFRTGNAVLTPYTDLFLTEGSNTYAAGLRYKLDNGLELDLEGAHKARLSGNNDNSVSLGMGYTLDNGLELDLEGTRTVSTSGNNDNRVSLQFRLPL